MSGTNSYSEGDLHQDYEIGSVGKKKRKEQTMRQTDLEKHLRGGKSELRHKWEYSMHVNLEKVWDVHSGEHQRQSDMG